MKIFQTNFLNYPRQTYQITPYKKQENRQDIFVKSNSVAFTGNDVNENPYQQVLQNPTLVQKVMELVTTAATILVGKAAGIGFDKNDNTIDVDKICKDSLEKQDEKNQEIEAYKQEIEQLNQENSRLKELALETKQPKTVLQDYDNISESDTKKEINSVVQEQELPEKEPSQEAEATDNLQPEKYVFVFPKKKAGVLSTQQKNLKTITSNLELNEKSGEKLTAVCKELLSNNSHRIGDKIVDNKDIISDFVEQLTTSTDENIDQIIDNFYEKCELDTVKTEEKKSAEELPKSDTDQDIENSTPKVKIYETERPVLKGVTVKGKIDLDSIKERGKRTTISGKQETPKPNDIAAEKKKRSRIIKPAISKPEKDFKETSKLELQNENTKSSIFTIPGTADKNVILDLKKLLLQFEHQIEKEDSNPRYQCGKALSANIAENAILKELRDHDYEHIDNSNITDIKNAIDSDPRFHEMFTLHAAMRLIDRFADFESNVPLEDQCCNILNKLTDILRKSFKEGLEVRRYKDDNGRIGLRLFVSEDIYDNSERAIFGTYPFRLGICENQPDSTYYNKRNKQPLICTIFTKGI